MKSARGAEFGNRCTRLYSLGVLVVFATCLKPDSRYRIRHETSINCQRIVCNGVVLIRTDTQTWSVMHTMLTKFCRDVLYCSVVLMWISPIHPNVIQPKCVTNAVDKSPRAVHREYHVVVGSPQCRAVVWFFFFLFKD